MPNENVLQGYACPECGHEESFLVAPVEIACYVTDEGMEPTKHCDWNWGFLTSWFTCTNCQHADAANKFYTEPK